MFKNNAKGIFEANPQLFVNKQQNGILIDEWQDIEALAISDPNFWQSEFFNFIKVK